LVLTILAQLRLGKSALATSRRVSAVLVSGARRAMPGEENPNMALSSVAEPQGAPGPQRSVVARMEKVLKRFEVTVAKADELTVIEGHQMVIIADDSGSMANPSVPPAKRKPGVDSSTRWDELRATISSIVDVTACFDSSGVDVFFLNREAVAGVKDSSDPRLVQAFETPPDGTTPLLEAMELVTSRLSRERPVLLFLLTDGEPNGGPEPVEAALKKLVAHGGGPKICVQIMVCTPDDEEVEWLNALDRDTEGLDVTDDYHTEQQEVLMFNKASQFTRGDWVMKAVLGTVSKKFDDWDERNVTKEPESAALCSCTVQ